jgi:hypothetical protein
MWTIAGILIVSTIIIFIEVPSLLKKKMKKELVFFSILLFFGTGLSMAQSFRMKIPNPLDWISAIYKPMSDALFSFLQ